MKFEDIEDRIIRTERIKKGKESRLYYILNCSGCDTEIHIRTNTVRYRKYTLCVNCVRRINGKKGIVEYRKKLDNIENRICLVCGSEFNPTGYTGKYCSLECRKVYGKSYYLKTPKSRYSRAKCNGKKKGFNLTLEYYTEIMGEHKCYYCSGNIEIYGSGLDRIDNSKGYEKDNVLPCCGRCNIMRGTSLTVKETQQLIDKLKELRGCEGSPWETV